MAIPLKTGIFISENPTISGTVSNLRHFFVFESRITQLVFFKPHPDLFTSFETADVIVVFIIYKAFLIIYSAKFRLEMTLCRYRNSKF